MYALNSRALALLALASCLALTVPASAQITFSVGSDVVDISQDKGNESDPSIAINYLSPSSLFVISATDNATQGLVTARSANYGVSWTANIIATNTGTNLVPAFGLPSAAFDSYGNLFVAYLPASEEGVAVIVSTNGGSTFTALTNLAAFDSTDTPRITAPAGGVAAGTVWVVYKDYSMVGTPLVAQGLQSTNLGTNGVFGPVQILPNSGGGGFPDIAAGPAGQVMVAYQGNIFSANPSPVYISVNTNAVSTNAMGSNVLFGTNFLAPVTAVSDAIGGFTYIASESTGVGLNAAAGLGWDFCATSTNYGKAYLVYTGRGTSNNLVIKTCFSTNSGHTWSREYQVNDDLAGSNDHFLPRMAVDPASGIIGYSWLDCRNDLGADSAIETNTLTPVTFVISNAVITGLTVANVGGIQNVTTTSLDASGGGGTNWIVTISGDNFDGTTFKINTNSVTLGSASITDFNINPMTQSATNTNSSVTLDCTNYLPNAFTDGTPNQEAIPYATLSLSGGTQFLPNEPLVSFSRLINAPAKGYASSSIGTGSAYKWGHYTALAGYQVSFFPVWPDNSDILTNNPDGALKKFDLYGLGGTASGSSVTLPHADLSIVVTNRPTNGAVLSDDTLSFYLIVSNAGPQSSSSVWVTNWLPPNVTLADVTPAPTASYSFLSPTELVFSMPSMAAHSELINLIRVTVGGGAFVTNIASIGGPLLDIVPTNNTNLLIVPVGGQTLALAMISSETNVMIGDTVTNWITVTNLGPSANEPIFVTNTYTPGWANFAAQFLGGAPGTYYVTNDAFNDGVVVMDFGLLATNQPVTVAVTATVTASMYTNGPFSVSEALAESQDFNPNPANSKAIIDYYYGEELRLSMSASSSSVPAGQYVTYTETVMNLGPFTNGNVLLTNTLSSNLGHIIVFEPATGYTIQGNQVVFDLGMLPLQQPVSIIFAAAALSTGAGVNQGGVGSLVFDPFLPFSTNQATVTVTPAASIITNLAVTPTATGAFIAFQTEAPATAQVQYGLSTDYTNVTSLNSTLSPNHLFLLTGLGRDTTYYFNILAWAPQYIHVTNGVFTIELENTASGEFTTTNSLILNTGDPTYSGTWTAGSVAGGIYQGIYPQAYYMAANTISGLSSTASAVYSPVIPTPGLYNVSIWHPQSSTFSTNAQVYVSGATNEVVLGVNETANGGGWPPLANDVFFAAGQGGNVTIQNNTGEAGKSVVANAVRWVYDPSQDSPTNGSVPAWWATYFFGPNASVSGSADSDGDGYSNYAEFVFGTDPTNPSSHLNFAVTFSNSVVTATFTPWQGGRAYELQSAADLSAGVWVTLTNSVTVDTNGNGVFTVTQPNAAASFYRIAAQIIPQ